MPKKKDVMMPKMKNVMMKKDVMMLGCYDEKGDYDAKEKVQKVRDLINMGKYDADLANYIPGLKDLAIQGMLDDIDTREKVAHPSYKDKEQLDFQILLTENYYVNPANIHICFPIKIKKKSNNNSDIDDDLITANNFFCTLGQRN